MINSLFNWRTKDEVGGIVLIGPANGAFTIFATTSTMSRGPTVISQEDIGEKYTRGHEGAETLDIVKPSSDVRASH